MLTGVNFWMCLKALFVYVIEIIMETGAARENWTPDLIITNDALYHWATAALLKKKVFKREGVIYGFPRLARVLFNDIRRCGIGCSISEIFTLMACNSF